MRKRLVSHFRAIAPAVFVISIVIGVFAFAVTATLPVSAQNQREQKIDRMAIQVEEMKTEMTLLQRQVQSRSSVAASHPVPGSANVGELTFKPRDVLAHRRNPIRLEAVKHVLALRVADNRATNGDVSFSRVNRRVH